MEAARRARLRPAARSTSAATPTLESGLPRVAARGRDRRPDGASRTTSSSGRASAGAVAQRTAGSAAARTVRSCYKLDARRTCGGRLTVGVAAPAEPVPPGADAGAEDGEGSDLLAGDLRVHEHQRDADPARPVRRSASSASAASATTSTRCSARSARSCARRGSTTSRSSARAGSARRSRARRSSRSTGSTSPPSSTPTRRKIGDRSATSRSASTGDLHEAVRDKNIIVGVLAVSGDARSRPPTTWSAPA